MDYLINELSDTIVDFTIKYTNVSREVKDFVDNKNIAIKNSDKIIFAVKKIKLFLQMYLKLLKK